MDTLGPKNILFGNMDSYLGLALVREDWVTPKQCHLNSAARHRRNAEPQRLNPKP